MSDEIELARASRVPAVNFVLVTSEPPMCLLLPLKPEIMGGLVIALRLRAPEREQGQGKSSFFIAR